ncbi:right-handed parallel beta-helix repeat-containing protein [Thalassotalea sp. PLHSN55]|uniref:right-handed parallel beta-helix repeat-containing protein n=1 Tax=Thalassotalea sp. PLHSN55 TaxID=3435888 RepID=UPI003F8562FD
MKLNFAEKILVSALAFSGSLGVCAKTLYVSTNGDNNNNGSESAPFATFAQANSVLAPGDTLIIEGGIYRQSMTISKSGTEDNPIKIRAKNGEQVLIKGTNAITNWTHYSGDIYQANVQMNVAASFRQVYQNDKLMQIARWPNDVDNNPYTLDSSVVTGKGTTSSIPTETLPEADLSNALMWYLGQHSGTSWTRTVTANTENQLSFTEITDQWPFSNHSPAKWTAGGGFGRFYLFNHFELLDHPREWYYDDESQIVYFHSTNGQMPVTGDIEYTARVKTITLNGNYIDVEGIDVMGGYIQIAGDFNQFTKGKVTHALERYASVDVENGSSIYEGSFLITGRNTVIKENEIKFGSANAIAVAGFGDRGDNTVIEKNRIQYFNTLGMHTSPIRSAGDNVKVLKNTISDTARDGIYVVGTGSEVAYNDVSRTGLINNDGGPFYTVGNANLRNIHVHHNWFHDAAISDFHDNRIAGIYLDNDSKGFLVHHNVVWNMPWSAVQLNWDNWDNHIYHNTFINVGQAMGEWINNRNPRDNRVWNNFSTNLDWIHSGAYDLDSNIIEQEIEQLVDPSNNNFMPNSNSFLLDQARTIENLDKPFTGPAPDVGAYELGGTAWTAGINAIEDVCASCPSNPNDDPIFENEGPSEPEPTPDPVEASLSIVDRDQYTTTTFTTDESLTFTVNYEAGTGNTVTIFNAIRGVRFFLRELTPSYTPVAGKAIVFDDESAIGQQNGTASATFSLAGLTPTADLPEGHFYQLLAVFRPSGASKNELVTVYHLDIVASSVEGDYDGDKDVDINDINGLVRAIQTRQSIDLAFDINDDGVVNILDARATMALCTRARCATE